VITKTFETPVPPTLDLSIPQGSVDIETVEGTQTHVELDCTDESGLDDAVVELRGNTVVVDIERRRLLGGMINISIGDFSIGGRRYTLRVSCPHASTLDVRTASAGVRARGRYAAADVKTASGDVTVADVDGDARAKSVSGDVELGRVGGTATIQAVSGDLRIRDADSSVSAKSVSGDVDLQVAAGDVELTSVSGDMRVAVRRGSRVYIDANSVSGDLDSELELADTPREGDGPLVELRAKTVSGDFRVVRA
jgi:hypothetical protein